MKDNNEMNKPRTFLQEKHRHPLSDCSDGQVERHSKKVRDKSNLSVWLQFAEEDFLSAEALLEKKIYNQVCFHSQQAAEKMLKAFLKSQGVVPPKIHSLLELLEMCKEKDNEFEALQKGCEYLSRFYLPARYPDALSGSLPEGLPNLEEAKKTLDFAKEIMDFIQGKV